MKYLSTALLLLTTVSLVLARGQTDTSSAPASIHFDTPASVAAETQVPDNVPQAPLEQAGSLLGKISDGIYFSPTGAFYLKIPVLPELGGRISDTERVVTFRDDFTTHISVAAFKLDATQSWQLSVKGLKDYLQYFLHDFVLPDFAANNRNLKIEPNGRFLPTLNEGSLVTFITIPGGSMFINQTPRLIETNEPAVAKRGNLLFIKNGYIYVISMELAERITEGSAYSKTSDEEDGILRDRLVSLVGTFHFIKGIKVN